MLPRSVTVQRQRWARGSGDGVHRDLERGFQAEELEVLPEEFGVGDVDFDPSSDGEGGEEEEM